MKTKKIYNLIIIGAGPIGLFTFFQVKFFDIEDVLIVDAESKIGGQCSLLYPDKFIYDIPAYHKIKGSELIDELLMQITNKFNFEYKLNTKIIKIKKNNEQLFELIDSNHNIFLTKSIIITAGAGNFEYNKLELNYYNELINKSIFHSIQDINLFKNKNIVINGGGDSACDWAIQLAEFAKSITIVHRRDSLKSFPENIKKIKSLEGKDFKLLMNSKISNLKKDNNKILTEIEIEDLKNNTKQTILCDYLLLFLGMKSENLLARESSLEMQNNEIIVNSINMSTNIDGIFAAGDCVYYDNKLKLILTGFHEAAIAIRSIYKFLLNKNPPKIHSTSKIT